MSSKKQIIIGICVLIIGIERRILNSPLPEWVSQLAKRRRMFSSKMYRRRKTCPKNKNKNYRIYQKRLFYQDQSQILEKQNPCDSNQWLESIGVGRKMTCQAWTRLSNVVYSCLFSCFFTFNCHLWTHEDRAHKSWEVPAISIITLNYFNAPTLNKYML